MKKASGIRSEVLFPVLIPVVILALWEIAVQAGYLKPLFFPPPSLIFRTAIRMIVTGELQRNLFPSLTRISLGFLLGTAPGITVGLLMGWSPKVRMLMDPIISTLYPIPKIAVLPLIMLLLGIGELSKITVVGIGSFFLVTINAMTGVRNINKIYFEVAKNYGASKVKILTKVILPGSLPMIFAGIRLALGMSLILVVAVEFNIANYGLGAMIWLAWQTLKTEQLYVGVIICAVLGIVFTSILKRIERHFMPWEETFMRQG
jgi:NitT/TauT family transport system permease protein